MTGWKLVTKTDGVSESLSSRAWHV